MVRQKSLIILLGVIILVAIMYGLSLLSSAPASTSQAPGALSEPPPFTSETAATLQKSKGFQLLVSYTDYGFQPAVASIKKGDTVRFTNNSSGALWVVAYSHVLYPKATGSCGASAFDSCREIGRGEFWEFTFTKAGTWPYQNKLDPQKSGSVKVK